MFKKYKYLLLSFALFIIFFLFWQITGGLAGKTGEMDTVTSYAVFSFLGTVFFLITTIILSLVTVAAKIKRKRTFTK